MDIAAQPEAVVPFLRHLARYHLETVRYVREHFRGRIHGYRGTDDWGTQAGPIISPSSFQQVFQPVYKGIFDSIHEAGMDAWIHSCGNNLAIIPHLIDAGVDVFNLLQPSVFPIPRLAAFKGRASFEVSPICSARWPRETGSPSPVKFKSCWTPVAPTRAG